MASTVQGDGQERWERWKNGKRPLLIRQFSADGLHWLRMGLSISDSCNYGEEQTTDDVISGCDPSTVHPRGYALAELDRLWQRWSWLEDINLYTPTQWSKSFVSCHTQEEGRWCFMCIVFVFFFFRIFSQCNVGVDVSNDTPLFNLILRFLPWQFSLRQVVPDVIQHPPLRSSSPSLPRHLHHHHPLVHTLFFSSQYILRQPIFPHFLGYFSHLRCFCNSFIPYSIQVGDSTHPS